MICVFDVNDVLDYVSQSDTIRVRPLCDMMKYNVLVRRHFIPDIEASMNKITTPSYPKFIKSSKCYAQYGMFMDVILRKYMSMYFDVNWGIDDQSLINSIDYEEYLLIANNVAADMMDVKPFLKSDMIQNKELILKCCMNIVQIWNNEYGMNLKFNIELSLGNVRGHPDILSDNILWDIKCGHTQKPIRKHACLQLLCYWAMSDYDYIGFILPLSGQLQIFDMRMTNKNLMRYEITNVGKYSTIHSSYHNDIMIKYPIGSHVLNDDLEMSVNRWVDHCYQVYDQLRPMQIYLENSRGKGQSSITVNKIPLVSDIINSYGIQFFVHAPLSLNIASHQVHTIPTLQRSLEQSVTLGAKGVVVHTGQYMKLTKDQAYQQQAEVLKNITQYATTDCKILLETPCGEGTEICQTLFYLNNFLQTNFDDNQLSKLGICVDTCHVFTSGASPLEYIKYWIENGCVGIGLVHFNDSINTFGTCIDRHALPGQGKIGYAEMLEIAKLCTECGIPMVHE